ncbi:MAG TPA: HEXXH motif-containing putative peptide modification protein [Candidatus Saccharimonadia bacterium]|nr:HEXXH motif-containing putative peptide modification protein [Candidatus Saccharimonadia bacterium]
MRLSEEQIESLVWCGQAQADVLPDLINERTAVNKQAVSILSMISEENQDILAPAAALLSQVPEEARQQALSHPQVGLWADYCLRNRSNPSNPVGHYRSIAAGAAIKASLPFDSFPVPIQRNGAVWLAGIGRAVFRDPDLRYGNALVNHDANGQISITAGTETVYPPSPDDTASQANWQSLRYLKIGSHDFELDDVSPELFRMFRMEGGISLSSRLGDAEVSAWQRTVNEAFKFLEEYLPQYRDSIIQTLRAIIPLNRGRHYIASRTQTLGSIGLVRVTDPWFTVRALVDESQKGIFKTLQDLYPTYSSAFEGVAFHSPNLDLPVTFGGLLQSLYGHAPAVEVLAAKCRSLPEGSEQYKRAYIEYAQWRNRYPDLASTVRRSPFLTSVGKTIVDSLVIGQERFKKGGNTQVPELDAIADTLNRDQYLCWRLRNLHPNTATIYDIASHILEAPTTGYEGCEVINRVNPGFRNVWGNYKRKELLLSKTEGNQIQPGDIANNLFAKGKHAEARALFAATIRDIVYTTQDMSGGFIYSANSAAESWAGLAITYDVDSNDPARRALHMFPEVVYGVYEALMSQGYQIDPLRLARTLGLLPNLKATLA